MKSVKLSNDEVQQIVEILSRRTTEVRAFHRTYANDPQHFGCVEMALSREIDRLEELTDKLLSEEDDE